MRHVAELDVVTRTITLDDGGSMTPDAVLIAGGGRPRAPGRPRRGPARRVHAALAGATARRSSLTAAEQAENVVVVGASFVGMETAASLRPPGQATSPSSAPEATPFERIAWGDSGRCSARPARGARASRFRLGAPRSHGSHGEPPGRRRSSSTTARRWPADLVIAGVGVKPATAFVDGVALDPDGGMQRRRAPSGSPEGVWAAGDVARYREPHVGERRAHRALAPGEQSISRCIALTARTSGAHRAPSHCR